MYFRIENKYNLPKNYFLLSTQHTARKLIWLYPDNSAVQALNIYCMKQYKTTLKQLCIKLLNNLNFSVDDSGDIIATFKNKKLEKIAALITYGNGKVRGSKILRNALH